MLLIHKLFKKHSLRSLESKLLVVAAASVFLVCKVQYKPVLLEKMAEATYLVWMKSKPPGDVAAGRGAMITSVPEFSDTRRRYYMS